MSPSLILISFLISLLIIAVAAVKVTCGCKEAEMNMHSQISRFLPASREVTNKSVLYPITSIYT